MAIATVKIHPFRYANFVHLDLPQIPNNPVIGDVPLDVGEAFPTDDAAAHFWDELKAGWIKHVAKRRNSGIHDGKCATQDDESCDCGASVNG